MDHDGYAVVLVNKVGGLSEEIYFKTVEDYTSYQKSLNIVNVKETSQTEGVIGGSNTKGRVYITKDNWKDLGLKVGDKISIDGVFNIADLEHDSYEGSQPLFFGNIGWPDLDKFKANLYKVEE